MLGERKDEFILYETPEGREKIFAAILKEGKEEIPKRSDHEHNIKEMLSTGSQDYLLQAIRELQLLQDRRNGIKSRYTEIEVNGVKHEILIRDAKEQKTYEPGYENWAIMGLNYFNAARKLLESNSLLNKLDIENKIRGLANIFFEKIKNCTNPEAELKRMLNFGLVPLLQKTDLNLSPEEIKKRLGEIRDFCNFDYPTHSVATITSIPDEKKSFNVLQIDVPMCGGFTPTQRVQLERIRNTDLREEQKLDGIDWYKGLPPRIKKLVRMHAKDILAGKTIPTQLRTFLPGIRNAAQERIYLDESKGVDDYIHDCCHTGTLAHELKEGNVDATARSILQLQKLTGADVVHLQSLLSPVNPSDDFLDDQVLKGMQVAAQSQSQESKTKFYYSSTPVNAIRTFSERILEGAELVCLEARELLNTARRHYNDDQFRLLLKDKEVQLLQMFIQTFYALSRIAMDNENKSLQYSALTNCIVSLYNKLNKKYEIILNEDNEPKIITNDPSCRSGKDRGGMARYLASCYAIAAHKGAYDRTGLKFNLPLNKLVQERMALSGHVRFQAGSFGGTYGAQGIKSDTKSAIPESMKKLPFVEKTAKYNKKFPDLVGTKWYKNLKAWAWLSGLGIPVTAYYIYTIYKENQKYNNQKALAKDYIGFVARIPTPQPLTDESSFRAQPDQPQLLSQPGSSTLFARSIAETRRSSLTKPLLEPSSESDHLSDTNTDPTKESLIDDVNIQLARLRDEGELPEYTPPSPKKTS